MVSNTFNSYYWPCSFLNLYIFTNLAGFPEYREGSRTDSLKIDPASNLESEETVRPGSTIELIPKTHFFLFSQFSLFQ